MLAGNTDAVIDPTGWVDFAESCKKRVLALIEKETVNH